MSTLLSRRGSTTTIYVEPFGDTLDGQGKPTYGSAVEVEGRVSEEVENIIGPDGSEEQTTLSVWVDGAALFHPQERDRFEHCGTDYVVRRRQVRRRLDGRIHHVKLLAREE
jgi:hypothetical protein